MADLCFQGDTSRYLIVYVYTGWYFAVLGHHKLELLGILWYRVSKGILCLYILKIVEIWSGVIDGLIHSQTEK